MILLQKFILDWIYKPYTGCICSNYLILDSVVAIISILQQTIQVLLGFYVCLIESHYIYILMDLFDNLLNNSTLTNCNLLLLDTCLVKHFRRELFN